MTTIHFIEGYHPEPLPNEPGVTQGAREGLYELWNASRPFPAHETYRGEFIHGVFYGVIYPDQDYADEYRHRAEQLDAHRIVFHTQDEVLTTMQAYYAEHYPDHDIDVYEHKFSDAARSFLNHAKCEEEK